MAKFPTFVQISLTHEKILNLLDWLDAHFIEGQYWVEQRHYFVDRKSYVEAIRAEILSQPDIVYIIGGMAICCLCEEDVAQIVLKYDGVVVD